MKWKIIKDKVGIYLATKCPHCGHSSIASYWVSKNDVNISHHNSNSPSKHCKGWQEKLSISLKLKKFLAFHENLNKLQITSLFKLVIFILGEFLVA